MVARDVVKARDEEIYTFIAKGGTYRQAASKWNLSMNRIHAIVRGVSRTTRLARQETALDKMISNLDKVMDECLEIGTASALQAYIRAQDQQAKLLGLYDLETKRQKQAEEDQYSSWTTVEEE